VLLESGIEKSEKMIGVDSFYSDPQHMVWPHFMEHVAPGAHIYNATRNTSSRTAR
jgi:hypothetical protein